MRHLLSISDLNRESAIGLLDTAYELSKISDGPMKKLPTLRCPRCIEVDKIYTV